MLNYPYLLTAIVAVFSTLLPDSCLSQKRDSKPNIIVIMIDDMGYGDLSCYGSTINHTPNIDRMASQGLKFSDFHSNGPTCSPTRAAFLTGMYQNRIGEGFDVALSKSDGLGLPLELVTLPEVLKTAGYATGMYGKWHLGFGKPYLPTRQGFDDFRGLLAGDGDHHTHIDRYGVEDWWHNEKLEAEDGYSVDLVTNHSIDFIKDHKDGPFFLYVAHIAIHFPWQGPNDPPHRKKGVDYGADKWGIIPDKQNVRPHTKAMVEAVDGSVGKILQALRDQGIEKNTLVFFTSDNGGYNSYLKSYFNISSNKPFRGEKGQLYEGGHRVAGIAYWPGRIKPGTTSQVALTMDLFPTFAALTKAKIPRNADLDGVNLLPLLLRQKDLPERPTFWKVDNRVAVRKGPWKLVKNGRSEELYNLDKDIGESVNVSEKYPDITRQMSQLSTLWLKADYKAKLKRD